ncbi:protein ORF130 [Lake sturgeon herpesvirus]|nr:protein ORF130 [Lake sturgeon herpesvirus]
MFVTLIIMIIFGLGLGLQPQDFPPLITAEPGWWNTYLTCTKNVSSSQNLDNLVWHDEHNVTIFEKTFSWSAAQIQSRIQARQNHSYVCVYFNVFSGQTMSSLSCYIPRDNSRFYLMYSLTGVSFFIVSIFTLLMLARLFNADHPLRRSRAPMSSLSSLLSSSPPSTPSTPSLEMVEVVNFINLQTPTVVGDRIFRRHSMET